MDFLKRLFSRHRCMFCGKWFWFEIDLGIHCYENHLPKRQNQPQVENEK